jgi:hypothetical protein
MAAQLLSQVFCVAEIPSRRRSSEKRRRWRIRSIGKGRVNGREKERERERERVIVLIPAFPFSFLLCCFRRQKAAALALSFFRRPCKAFIFLVL